MKLKKYIIALIFTVFFCFISFNFASAKNQIPSAINIGLYYGDTALKSLKLSSEDGFLVGFKYGSNLDPFAKIVDTNISISLVDLEDFTLIKDGFKDQKDAENFAKNIGFQENIYILYDKSWQVIKVKNLDTNGSGYLTVKGSFSSPGLVFPVAIEDFISFIPIDQNLICLGNLKYRGIIKIKPLVNGKMTVINELGLEEYLYGVVPREMPASWPVEALKSQAVAARTYAVSNISKWGKYGFDITGSTKDQVYGGYNAENPKSNEAVDQTRGQIALYNGKPITALYHSDSGGITEDNYEVFGSDIPYLKSVKEIYETSSPNKIWEKRYSINEINQSLKEITKEIGRIVDISIIEKSGSKRARKLLISGTKGERILTGKNFRELLGLKSTFFEIYKDNLEHVSQNVLYAKSSYKTTDIPNLKGKYIISSKGIFQDTEKVNILSDSAKRKYKNDLKLKTNNTFIFVGKGWGHGVGMSQWGAKAMAENGHNYIEILQHYYNGVRIK